MRITFDAVARSIQIATEEAQSWGANLVAAINRHGQRLPMHRTQFGVIVTRGAETLLAEAWPRPGVTYVRTDQDVLETARVRWQPDDEITLSVWMESALGRVEDSATFTVPRPAQPYPSWTWQGGRWAPPVAYPEDGGEYVWDEADGAWVAE